MEKVDNLNNLLLYHLRDVYDAENTQMEQLHKIKSAIQSLLLTDVVDYYFRELQKHFRRLERIFNELNKEPEGKKSIIMEGLLKEATNLIKITEEGETLDAALSNSIQHMNHYEIAVYGTAITLAKAVGKHDIAESLLETMREKKQYDLELSNLTDELLIPHSEEEDSPKQKSNA
ncbi:MAG TPA: DUF892 family protein [Balneolales bacterium]|nr:DUF892 family protein [Balneolales bacterium]